MNDEKTKILEFCSQKFLADGFLKTTMDEIASEIRMSKKTIYKYFDSKDDLVQQTINQFTGKISEKIDTIVVGNFDSIEKLIKIGEIIFETTLKVSEKWIKDLNAADKKFWQQVEDFRTKTIFKNFEIILSQGKDEGLIINESTIILITVFIGGVRATINPEFLVNNNFSAREAGRKTLNILISGMLTKKGRKLFKKHLLGNKNESDLLSDGSTHIFTNY